MPERSGCKARPSGMPARGRTGCAHPRASRLFSRCWTTTRPGQLHGSDRRPSTRRHRQATTRTSEIQRKEPHVMLAPDPTATTISGQQRYVIAYFALVLASAGIPALLLLAFPGVLPTLPILLLASWMPNVVGIIITAKAGGGPALQQLFGRAVRWRFGLAWYAVALLVPIA